MKPNWTPIRIKLGQIQTWEPNPRVSTKAQAQRLIDSERKFGQPLPFLVEPPSKNGMYPLLDGHQRLAAWLTVYGADYEVDAMMANRPLTDREHRELVVTLHTGATGSWDWDVLSSWDVSELREWGMDENALKEWNNDALNLREMLTADDVIINEKPELKEGDVGSLTSPFQLKNWVIFPSNNFYGIPELRSDMLLDIDSIETYGGENFQYHGDNFLIVYRNRSFYGDKSKSVLCFYTYDHVFEEIFSNAGEVVEKILSTGYKGCVTPNFSVLETQPRIVQIYQIYKSFWCGRYMQEVGIKVIPDVEWIDIQSVDYALLGIPDNPPVLSCQMQTSIQTEEEYNNRFGGFEEVIIRKKPKKFMIYGCPDGDRAKVQEICQRHNVKPIFAMSVYQITRTLRKKMKGGDSHV